MYGIVKESRGYIDVTSQLGRGSRFTVMFPRVPSQATEAEQVAASRPKPETSATILLVEDDEGIRRLVSAVLRSGVRSAGGGRRGGGVADVAATQGGCDLLITDVILPRMKAAVLAQGARTMFPDIQVLYISGYAGDMLECAWGRCRGRLSAETIFAQGDHRQGG